MLKEMSKMHEKDAHDDNLIAMETSNQVHTRAQLRSAENAADSHILETGDLNNNTNSPLDVRNDTPDLPAATQARNTTTLLSRMLPPSDTSSADIAASRPSVVYDEHGIDLRANLADYSELTIAKALARHSIMIDLPKHYAPNHLIPEGKMRVVAVKAKKISSKKAVLIVKFISPPSLKDVHMQLFCTSLGPKTKQGQGADLSILTALKITKSP